MREQVEGRIVDAMKELGFTASESRTYIALLKTHPATGYELAARSGVPRSAIYNVLRRLEAQGLINSIQQKPAKFLPLPPERLFELLETRFARSLDHLKSSLTNLQGPTAETATWSVRGYPAMVEAARTLIKSAERSLYGSVWRREVLALAEPLARAHEREVEVALFSFNQLPDTVPSRFCYGIAEHELEAYWPHKIILIADQTRLLVGGAEQTEENRAVITDEATLVEMAVSNLVLDLTLFGERTQTDVSAVVGHLTKHLAPVENLVPMPAA